MSAQRIPTDPILHLLWDEEQRVTDRAPWAWWWRYEDIPAITEAMPNGTTEDEAKATMQSLIDSGLVAGCCCGCRGDFELTSAGRDYVEAHRIDVD